MQNKSALPAGTSSSPSLKEKYRHFSSATFRKSFPSYSLRKWLQEQIPAHVATIIPCRCHCRKATELNWVSGSLHILRSGTRPPVSITDIPEHRETTRMYLESGGFVLENSSFGFWRSSHYEFDHHAQKGFSTVVIYC